MTHSLLNDKRYGSNPEFLSPCNDRRAAGLTVHYVTYIFLLKSTPYFKHKLASNVFIFEKVAFHVVL